MDLRLCKICPIWFEPKNKKDRSVYCSDECRKEGARIAYNKWKENHPERFKEFQSSQYKNRARNRKVRVKNAYRGTPQPEIRRYCKYPGCQELTGNSGANYYYCDHHWKQLSENCSSQYPDFLYSEAGCDVEGIQTIKDGKRSQVI